MASSHSRLQLHYLWLGLAYAALLVVAVLSLVPISGDSGVSDKLIHLLIYAFLSCCFSLIVSHSRSLYRVFFGLVLFGLGIEFLQGMTDYRSAELADALANSAGILIGLMFYFTPLHAFLRRIDAGLYRLWQ